MSRVFDIASAYVDEIAALDPITATYIGVPGHEREMPDLSPEGLAAVAELNRRTAGELERGPSTGSGRADESGSGRADESGSGRADGSGSGRADEIAREVMLERLGVSLDLYEAGEPFRSLRIIASPFQRVRDVFDQMPKSTAEEWSNIVARLRLLPGALAGYRRTLEEGVRRGLVASQRQVQECAEQAATWSGQKADKPSFFRMLEQGFEAWASGAARSPSTGSGRPDGAGSGRPDGASSAQAEGLRRDVEEGVRAAMEAYAGARRWLLEEYLPRAGEREAAGEERYGLLVRNFLGTTIDPRETYEWGWEELYRIEREMSETAERIAPGAGVRVAMDLLENDRRRSVEGVEAYREWLQGLHDEAVRELDGRHFDIPAQIRRVEVMIPPPGGALAAYYTGPSEDFSRPGRTWWPAGERSRFPKWADVSTAYHEGVPGHHLQVGMAHCAKDTLSRFQQVLTFVSGHGEGWALYAERLMGELGYLSVPDYYMGMLSNAAMRAVRVVIDIGMHLELRIPGSERFHPGETWGHDLALEFSVERSGRPRDFMRSEVARYLGWPAQAISYKVGERRWLAAREEARRRQGDSFDLKRFHTEALNLGPMGLAQLERELSRALS